MFDQEGIKFWFSECRYLQYSKTIEIHGCILSRVKVNKICAYIGGHMIGEAKLNILRLDVYERFLEYKKKDSGWMIKRYFNLQNTMDEVELRLYLVGEEKPYRFRHKIKIESGNPFDIYNKFIPIDSVQWGLAPITPLDQTKDNLFDVITKKERFSCLVICRPFLPNKDTNNDELHYYFVDEKRPDKVSISIIVRNYSYTFVEEMIYGSDVSFFESLETICIPVDNFIFHHHREFVEPRITFLVSSDTHADFITRTAAHFKEVQYIIPGLTFKDDGAAKTLAEKNIKYVEIGYNDRKCKELEDFAPDFIFCGADWTSEFIAISRIAKKLSIPIISLQEGPQDWHMKFLQRIKNKNVLKIPNHYRNSDILFSQGAVTLNHIRPKYFAITGNPKINKIVESPFPGKPLVLINCNFTYIATKPAYENNRERWLKDVISACKEVKINYFISQHPRDDAKLEDPNVIKSSASVVKEQILKASIIISRFSSIPYEALALGREAIYYNPHREPMLTFTEDVYGAVKLAANKTELWKLLKEHKNRMFFDKEKVNHYLTKHCGPMDGKTFDRMIALFRAFSTNHLNYKKLKENTESKCSLFDEKPEFHDKKLNIAVFSRNSPIHYSGGRYCAYMLAEALSYAGHKVFFITEYLPIFYADFHTIPSHQNIEICLTTNFQHNLPIYSIDVVFLTPGMDEFKNYYINAIAFARSKKAHLVLINFESPNWFNQLSPLQRDFKLWENWDLISRYSSLILSNSGEGQKYAEEYYTQVPKTARFDYSHLSINTFVADKVLAKKIKKQKRIVIFARFSLASHKGCFNIPDIICEAMRGYTFVILLGTGTIPADIYSEILNRAGQFGVGVESKYKLSDYEKFMEIRKAALLLFPSFFEGYGYPPIEALYFNTPCIAFELPVLRETCEDNLIFVPRGDWSAFKEKIKEVLKSNKPIHTNEKIRKVATFEEYAKKIDNIAITLAASKLPEELVNFKLEANYKQEEPFNKKDELKVGRFLNPVSRFIKNHLSYHKYERLKEIYKEYKTKKKSAVNTIAAFISLFTRKRDKYSKD